MFLKIFRSATLGLFGTIFVSVTPLANAQIVSVQGIGQYTKTSKSLSAAEEDGLKTQALRDAILRHSANFSASDQTLFNQKRSKILSRANEYFASVVVLDNTYDRKGDMHTMVVRGQLNVPKLQQTLVASQQSYTQANQNTGPLSIAILFVAREAIDKRAATVDRNSIRENESADNRTTNRDGTQSSSIAGDTSRFNETSSAANHSSSISSNQRRQRDIIRGEAPIYELLSMSDISATISNNFTQNNIGMEDFYDIIGYCSDMNIDDINSEFVRRDALTPKTRIEMFEAAKTCETKFVAIGTLDADTATTDPVTGKLRVNVSVRFKVSKLREGRRPPQTLAAVGPVMYSGLGPTRTEARKKALAIAGQKAASEITSILRAKGY